MNDTKNLIGGVKKQHLVAIFVIVAALVTLVVTCTKSPEKIVPVDRTTHSPAEQNLLGTWISTHRPEQKFIFTKGGVKYRELNAIVLEGFGTYTFEPDGTVEWTITWYSGNSTRWKGVIGGEKITVEFVNSWDGSHGEDILTKLPGAD